MQFPTLQQPIRLLIKGKTYRAKCTDFFGDGFGRYLDADLGKKIAYRFTAGDQCTIPELGPDCLADFVSYLTKEGSKVRFLIMERAPSKEAAKGR